ANVAIRRLRAPTYVPHGGSVRPGAGVMSAARESTDCSRSRSVVTPANCDARRVRWWEGNSVARIRWLNTTRTTVFGLFGSEPFRDADLGELRRSRGYWKGAIILPPCGTFRVSLAGSRQAPDQSALKLAKELPQRIHALIPDIQSGLFDHYAP